MTSLNNTIWDNTKEPLVLKNKVEETHDSMSFYFQTPSHAYFKFKPGQFVTIKAHIKGKTFARSYSISSLPESNILQLTVKRVHGGTVSNWLLDDLKIGEELWTYGIAGDFNAIDHASKPKTLMLSSGCGIAPIISMTDFLINSSTGTHQYDIMFIYRAVDAHSVIFLDRIAELQEQHPHFKACILLKSTDEKELIPTSLQVIKGTLTLENLKHICLDYQERSVYLCGTSSFMKNTKQLLEQSGFDMQHFYQESFTSAGTEPVRPICVEEVFTVKAPKFGFENTTVEQGASLLDTLVDGNVPIIAACHTGLCGACMCKVTKGKVESSSTGPLNQRQIDEGVVLACCSTIIEDVEIDL